jgi:hypothetical protein
MPKKCQISSFQKLIVFSIFLLLPVAGLCLGHSSSVSVSDPSVEYVKDFVISKLPLLFPDAKGTPEIESAERQTVAGYNFKLAVKIPRSLSLIVTLWVNIDQQISPISISQAENGRALAGGWRWQSFDSLTEDDKRALKALIVAQKGFRGEVATIFAVRFQTVTGRNQHVIFSDGEGNLHSVVVCTNLEQEQKVTVFQTVTGRSKRALHFFQ